MTASLSGPHTAHPTAEPLPVAGTRSIVSHLWFEMRRQWWQLVTLAAAMTAAATLALVVPRTLGDIVDVANHGGRAGEVWRLAAIMTGAALGAAVFSGLSIMLSSKVFETILAALREKMLAAAFRLSLRRIESVGSGDLVSRATADVSTVSEAIGSAVPALLTSGFTIAVTAVGLAALDWRFLLVVPAVLPVYVNGIRVYLRRSSGLYAAERAATARRAHHVLGAIHGLDSVHAFDLSRRLEERIEHHSWAVVRWTVRAIVLHNRLGSRINFGELVGMSTILVVGFVLVRDGSLTVGETTTAMLFFLLLFDPIGQVMMVVDTLQSGAAALGRVVGVIEESEGQTRGSGVRSGVRSVPGAPAGASQLLQVRDVRYSYSEDHEVLQGVSLNIAEGEHVALVGSSGAGKTTLASIAAGIHRPSSGRVAFRGVDVDDIDATQLPRSIALVTQEVHVFAGTLRADLQMAAPDADEDRLSAALEQVGAAEWVRNLPSRLDTVVGEGGHRLSPLQTQQLALARLVLLDPALAVLDEATADAGSIGAELLEASAEAALRGRAALVVAHRLSQAVRADRIVYLEHGHIVETGSHAELVAAGGRYSTLWAAWSHGRGAARIGGRVL